MYAFDIHPAAGKSELYAELLKAADALTADEPDGIANMANVAALLWQFLPDLNWAGFYRVVGHELVLGRFRARQRASAFRSTKACAAQLRGLLPASVLKMSTPSPVISLATPTAVQNWLCRFWTKEK
jgi:hypothetical protein